MNSLCPHKIETQPRSSCNCMFLQQWFFFVFPKTPLPAQRIVQKNPQNAVTMMLKMEALWEAIQKDNTNTPVDEKYLNGVDPRFFACLLLNVEEPKKIIHNISDQKTIDQIAPIITSNELIKNFQAVDLRKSDSYVQEQVKDVNRLLQQQSLLLKKKLDKK